MVRRNAGIPPEPRAGDPRAPRVGDRTCRPDWRSARVRIEARGRCEGLRQDLSGPWWGARPDRQPPARRAGRRARLERLPLWDDGLMTSPIRIAILGATGSIGRQALDVVRAQPDRLRVVALGANRNADALRELAMEFPTARTVLGSEALVALATDADADLVLVATPGVAALRATVAALEDGKRVALANKEVLVAAGHLIRRLSGGAGGRGWPGGRQL